MLATRGAAGKSYVQLCEQSRSPLNSTRKQSLTNSKRTQAAHGEDINSTAGHSIAFDGFSPVSIDQLVDDYLINQALFCLITIGIKFPFLLCPFYGDHFLIFFPLPSITTATPFCYTFVQIFCLFSIITSFFLLITFFKL